MIVSYNLTHDGQVIRMEHDRPLKPGFWHMIGYKAHDNPGVNCEGIANVDRQDGNLLRGNACVFTCRVTGDVKFRRTGETTVYSTTYFPGYYQHEKRGQR